MVREILLDISEAHCFMQSRKNLEVLDFLLETWNKVKENCTLTPP
jgi:hypothetical protein